MSAALQLPRLRPDQWAIARHPAKVKVLSMGRRWGKTTLGGAVSMATAASGGRVAWVVPNYKNGRSLWRWAESVAGPLRRDGLVRTDRSERVIEFRDGGFLGVFSADNEDSMRGEAFHLAILDEAARIAETAWTDVIQPTLADYGGDAILISTPKGRNWFWQEWIRGQDGGRDIMSYIAPSAANPNPLIQRAAELARERVPERTYRQEWLAEFLEDGGGVFRRVTEAATAPYPVAPYPGTFVMGVDWGKSADWTALVVIDAASRTVVDFDRFNQIDYHVQRQRLEALARRWDVAAILAEQNSIGVPNIEELHRAGLPVRGFQTTNATKAEVIEALALAIETRDICFPPIPQLVAELQAYELDRLPSGLVRYGAPAGMHDDCVIALALAWAAAGKPMGSPAVGGQRPGVAAIGRLQAGRVR